VRPGATRDLLVWVSDSGTGIAPEHLPHIFDRFWQASRTERHGTGLGLTICKGIVEAHNGRIWAESVPGDGTTLYFTLPAAGLVAEKKSIDRKANILIVDDRPENLMALEAILERPEVPPHQGDFGRRSVEHRAARAVRGRPHRRRDAGHGRTRRRRQFESARTLSRYSIIFITAFGNDPEEIHRAYSAGGADYLVKPLDAEIVRKKVCGVRRVEPAQER
jgi:CheY-like chemotaxis protein